MRVRDIAFLHVRMSRTVAGDPAGLVGMHVMSWVGLSPGFLPRSWWSTATNLALSQAAGYLVGKSVGRIGARAVSLFRRRPTGPRHDRAGEEALVLGLTAATGAYWSLAQERQRQLSLLMEMRPVPLREHMVGTVVGSVGGVGILATLRGLRITWRTTTMLLKPVLPNWSAPAASGVLVAGGTYLLLDRVFIRRILERISRAAQQANELIQPDRYPPQEPERSGSPASYESWERLGFQGRAAVSEGPRARDIAAATGRPACEPIRVYIGRQDWRSVDDAARAAVAEMHRTDAFSRSYILLVGTTGTGWIPQWSVSAVEFLTGGDVATAALQYTFLPSGLTYLADKSRAMRASAALVREVRRELEELPAESRPKLLVTGESLGGYGMTGAFFSAKDMLEIVDGAVFTGIPRTTPMWRQLTRARRPSSPETAPVLCDSSHIRFATSPEGVWRAEQAWKHPRVVFLQYPSDPIVWCNMELMVRRPDWMREPRGRDVLPGLTWYPWGTFWQLAVNMPASVKVPGGHGHRYHEDMVPVWADVLGVAGSRRADAVEEYRRICQAIDRLTLQHN